jgi:uncharacterized protein YqeY
MSEDAAAQMRSRLRSDLLTAMRCGRKLEVALIRELVAAIDNAEAPRDHAGRTTSVRHEFRSGSAEVARLVLSRAEVHALLLNEIERRERAASEFERLGEVERADALRTQALVAKRYIE